MISKTESSRIEEKRLQALKQLYLLDTPPSESFDRITRMASKLFNLPIAAVSLTDKDRQWFKSRVGVDHWEIPRERAPCGEVADSSDLLVLPDLMADVCYSKSLLADSGIRFYAGAPLVTREGYTLGAMCVLGTEPREFVEDERGMLRDLAATVMAQIELQHAVGRVEPISGLPNRHQLMEDLDDQARDRPLKLCSLVVIELADAGQLQQMLRVLGPSAVDQLTRECVAILLAMLPPGTKVYQVGPAQVAWAPRHRDELQRWDDIEAISSQFKSVNIECLPNSIRPAMGVAPFTLGRISAEAVLRAAHNAVQDARNSDCNVSVYSEIADDHHKRKFRLLADMRSALIAADQLYLVYQPKVSLVSGNCVGVEALLRWCHPELGEVSPGEFIPLVEQTDLISPLTAWVLRAVIEQIVAWGSEDIPVSVNISPPNLEEPHFAELLVRSLNKAGVASSLLEVEVTEGALIRDGSRVREQLQMLRDAGIRVAIDDFGTGYSSLSYIQDLPADVIKIDQSFIRDLMGSGRARTLVHSLVQLGRGLDFKILAEGIEYEGSFEFLRLIGCHEGQGYWLSRPLRAKALIAWTHDRPSDLGALVA